MFDHPAPHAWAFQSLVGTKVGFEHHATAIKNATDVFGLQIYRFSLDIDLTEEYYYIMVRTIIRRGAVGVVSVGVFFAGGSVAMSDPIAASQTTPSFSSCADTPIRVGPVQGAIEVKQISLDEYVATLKTNEETITCSGTEDDVLTWIQAQGAADYRDVELVDGSFISFKEWLSHYRADKVQAALERPQVPSDGTPPAAMWAR